MDELSLFKLIDKFEETKLTKLVYEKDGVAIRLEKDNINKNELQPVVRTESVAVLPTNDVGSNEKVETSNCVEIKSPLAGIFYDSPSPTDAPFITVGQMVKKGQVVCLVEAMKLMNEITAPCDGKISKILIKNEDVVSYDQTMVEVEQC